MLNNSLQVLASDNSCVAIMKSIISHVMLVAKTIMALISIV